MWKCERCGAVFGEPEYKEFCYEDYCGVGEMFPNKHYGTYGVCPECRSEDIDTYYDDDEVITYCEINECPDCPRYGDDCDGRNELP